MELARLAESEADELAIANGDLPWGYHEDALSGGRNSSVVETDYEIEVHYVERLNAGVKRPVFSCAYCGDTFRSASLDAALVWWNAHDCLTLEDRERAALLYDHGVSLPKGHPFAPTVDGRGAA